MTVADLSEVRLKVFVPETQIGLVKLGQKVQVTVDSYPGQIFEGEVSYISPRAEFTPKNVQTKEERVNTVFAVKVSIPNPEMHLKPGMPADAVIGGNP
jgi:HlyD family secretion protein